MQKAVVSRKKAILVKNSAILQKCCQKKYAILKMFIAF
ncbi:hypothetical protein SpAn4DRAFT_5004 [Sporomusa ovata]|uniref:Uncharacterized protein n=1 Tax=Sporomusa ovata TaxID=2378 RepID=A0A0U1KWY5_9FIRM|nr:hypothetical protein SpAn4DRAFT_5004 [Sporomusa ovata]